MLNFPRLNSVFGCSLDELDDAAIAAAIDALVIEDFDLEWKGEPYLKAKNSELAKDVAALANASGGVIIVGVREEDSRAAHSAPFELSLMTRERVAQIVAEYVKPFLHGVEVRPIETSAKKGYLLIAVPRSFDAPHAVTIGKALNYPIRHGTTTHHLSEYEVAARYRDRFASRAESDSKLDQVHADGISKLALWVNPFLTVSLVPTNAGDGGVGNAALAKRQAFLNRWSEHGMPLSSFGWQTASTVPGIRRAILSDPEMPTRRSKGPHCELHYDGASFAATNEIIVKYDPAFDSSGSSDRIAQDLLEWALLDLVLLLSHHAVDVGAAGECMIRAHLKAAIQTSPDSRPQPAQIFRPVSPHSNRDARIMYSPIAGSNVVRDVDTHPAAATTSLAEIASDKGLAIVTAYGLAADILGEFGVAEPLILRSDGMLNTVNLFEPFRPSCEKWASDLGLSAT